MQIKCFRSNLIATFNTNFKQQVYLLNLKSAELQLTLKYFISSVAEAFSVQNKSIDGSLK